MDAKSLKNILEAGLLVAGRALSIAQLEALFQHEDDQPDRKEIRAALEELKQEYEGRGIELVEVASGFRLQSHSSVSNWVANLFQEKTPRYSRALLETLVLIAYRQPITRAEIEDVRGVAVSSNIIKTLQERKWVKVLGHKDVPGKPALLGTSKEFLDYFNLKKLDELPDLADIKDLDQFDELLAEEAGELDDNDEAESQANGENDGSSAGGPSVGGVDGEAGESDGSGQEPSAHAAAGAVAENTDGTNDESNDDVPSGTPGSDPSSDDGADSSIDQSVAPANIPTDMAANAAERFGRDDNDENGPGSDDQDGNPAHNETLSGAEIDLMRVISEFSDEHQQQIDARDQMEADMLTKDESSDDADSSEDGSDNDSNDLSQRLGDDKQSGPSPGDTLH